MAGLFGGGPAAPPPPPPMPILEPAPPMPTPDPDEERRAAAKEIAQSMAGKTTQADTIIGGFNNGDDTLGAK